MTKPLRIAVGGMFTETTHFLTTIVGLEHWRNGFVLEGDEVFALRNATSEEAGVLAVLDEVGASILPLAAARTVSGGPSSDTTYAFLKEAILQPLRRGLPVDGVLLALHGSMTAISEDDPEGDLLAAVRELVGPEVPIVASLDMHANVTARMVASSDAMVSFTRYPHDDTKATGERAARLLLRIIEGTHATMALAKVPVLVSGVRGMTFGDAPMVHLTAAARALEKQPGVLSVSIIQVHPFNDLPGMGSGAIVITDNDAARAASLAKELAQDFWNRRHDFEPEVLSVAEAVARGRAIAGQPVVLVDTADCVGGGAAGDSIAMLRDLLALGVTEPTLLMVVDPAAAQRCAVAGIGAQLTTTIGYGIDPSWGTPITVTGTVRHLLDGEFVYTGGAYGGTTAHMGLSAVLAIGSISVLVMSRPTYDWADEQFRAAGLDVRQAKFIGAKNPMNYHFAYDGLAKAHYVVDLPGPNPASTRVLPYKRMQRPFFPFDEDIEGLEPALFVNPGAR
jgi:microcystin degradation protein MlrC